MVTLKEVQESLSEHDKFMDNIVEELRESPYAKKGNLGNPGTDVYSSGGVQEKPYRVLSKAD